MLLKLIIINSNQFKAFSTNLNAQHMNGMTPFYFAAHSDGKLVKYIRVDMHGH